MKNLIRVFCALVLIPSGYYFVSLLMEASQTRNTNMLLLTLGLAVVNTILIYGVWQPKSVDYQAGHKRVLQARKEKYNAQVASKFDEIE